MKFRLTPVAAALTTLFAIPSIAAAQDASATAPEITETIPVGAADRAESATQLPSVTVEAQRINEYKPEKPASAKYTEPLLNIPQTVQIVPAKVIQDQNQLTLRDMLGNVPGITFGAAEGGNGFGDNITLRGARVDSDIYVDGIRDSAQTSRVDPFNLEQLEVTKGASSVYSGGGAIAGTINLISKTAKADDFVKLSGGVGTDSYFRGTVDANKEIDNTTAFRVNVMSHQNDTPGRNDVSAERWGIAGSLAFGLGTDTRITVNAIHQDSEGVPDRGLLWRRADAFTQGAPVPVKRETYFGWSNLDRQQAKIDSITAVFERDINSNVTLKNTTRYAQTSNFSSQATMNGLVCIDSDGVGGNPSAPFKATGTCPAPLTPGGSTFTMTGTPGNIRDDNTNITANVTDITWKLNKGIVEQTIVTGLSITRENFDRDGEQVRNPGSPNTAVTVSIVRDLYNPNTIWTGPLNYELTTQNRNETDNQAIYVFDTIKVGPQWLFSAGLRYERNEAIYNTYNTQFATISATNPAPGTSSQLKATDHFLTGRAGITFKPVESGSVYFAYGNSAAPASSNAVAACASDTCNVDPEKTVNYELGTKWDLFSNQLAVTAAIFRNDKLNARVPSGDDAIPYQVLDGKSRVQGFELGASGQITKAWSIYAGYAYLDSEVLQNISSNPDDPLTIDYQKGDQIPATPRNSGNLWTSYVLPFGLELGYGLRYVGKYQADGNSATVTATTVPGYVMHNALVGYKVDKNLMVRLNANNITDKLYWSSVRANGWAKVSDARSFVLTADYNF